MALKAVARRAPVVLTIPLVLNSSAVDQNIFIADRIYDIESISESHAVAGNDAGAVTLDVKKASGTTAIASGTSVLASTFNMKSTANTVVSKTKANGGLSAIPTSRLSAGDRLGFDITGTTTSYAGGTVTVVLTPVQGSV